MELAAVKVRLSDFLFEIALQIQARLPDNLKRLQKVSTIEPRAILGCSDTRTLSEFAVQFQSVAAGGVDISGIESDWRRLRHASLSVNSSTPLLKFWSAVFGLWIQRKQFSSLSSSHQNGLNPP